METPRRALAEQIVFARLRSDGDAKRLLEFVATREGNSDGLRRGGAVVTRG